LAVPLSLPINVNRTRENRRPKTSFAFVKEVRYHNQIDMLGSVDESCIQEVLTDQVYLVTVYVRPEA
jgi:hypothetical protein